MTSDINSALAEFGLKIEVLPIDVLRPYPSNNKRHGQKDLAAIYSSINKFGFKEVIIVDKDYEVIAGHGRILAAKEKGFDKLPVLVALDLSKTDAKAYRIAHNRTANIAKYDDGIMTSELGELKLEGFELGDLADLKLDKWTKDLDVPEFNLDEYEPTPVEEQTKNDVPDQVFPTDNEWGIPVLSLKMQANAVDLPVVQWGDIARKQKFRGTYHWYCEDDKFESMWKDPTGPLASNCINCVEPNFSNYADMARAYVMGMIYKKRWIARYWQTQGMFIFVDMNVNSKFYDLNMFGVPSGWRAYFTRGYADHPDKNISQYQIACDRAGSDDIIFVVYGGGKTIENVCAEHGWLFIRDRRSYQRDEWTQLFNMQNHHDST
jgi:hypothetical protein